MRTDFFCPWKLAGSLDSGEGRSSVWALEAGPNPEGGFPSSRAPAGFCQFASAALVHHSKSSLHVGLQFLPTDCSLL